MGFVVFVYDMPKCLNIRCFLQASVDDVIRFSNKIIFTSLYSSWFSRLDYDIFLMMEILSNQYMCQKRESSIVKNSVSTRRLGVP